MKFIKEEISQMGSTNIIIAIAISIFLIYFVYQAGIAVGRALYYMQH